VTPAAGAGRQLSDDAFRIFLEAALSWGSRRTFFLWRTKDET